MPLYAQFSNTDLRYTYGMIVGIEKNNSVWLDYGFDKSFHINIKHTAMADKLYRQSWQISGSYNITPKHIQVNLSPFLTSDWYGTFVNYGCSFRLSNLWRKERFMLGIEYVPYYDNELRSQNGWALAAQVKVQKDISFFTEYGRKPDYRIAYKRVYSGFEIIVADLYVKPMLEIPIYDSGLRLDHSKLVVSMFYSFKKNRKK